MNIDFPISQALDFSAQKSISIIIEIFSIMRIRYAFLFMPFLSNGKKFQLRYEREIEREKLFFPSLLSPNGILFIHFRNK